MKTILTLSVLVALVCGCRQTTSQPKLTPEDVAWATGTRIAKWDLRTLTSKPVYAVGLVLLGATNEVLSQSGLIGGFQTPISSAGGSEVRVALQRDMLQFGCDGSSSESKLDPGFELRFWYGSTLAPVRDLVPIASDASQSSDQPDAILASRSKKLCLRIYTEPFTSGKPTGAAVADVQQFEFPPSKSPQELQARVEAALKAKDLKAIGGLFNWTGVSTEMRSFQVKNLTTLVAAPSEGTEVSTRLQPSSVGSNEENVIDGILYFPNVQVLGNLVLSKDKLENGTNFGRSVALPYGQTNGTFYLAGTRSRRIYEPKNKDKHFRVVGMGGAFTGSCVYVQNGKEITKALTELNAGGGGVVLFGDYVKQCRIKKSSEDARPLQLVIREDERAIFESEPTREPKLIVYERKN